MAHTHPEAQYVRTVSGILLVIAATVNDNGRVHPVAQGFAHLAPCGIDHKSMGNDLLIPASGKAMARRGSLNSQSTKIQQNRETIEFKIGSFRTEKLLSAVRVKFKIDGRRRFLTTATSSNPSALPTDAASSIYRNLLNRGGELRCPCRLQTPSWATLPAPQTSHAKDVRTHLRARRNICMHAYMAYAQARTCACMYGMPMPTTWYVRGTVSGAIGCSGSDAGEQRRLEPPAVLIRSLHVEIGLGTLGM